MAPYFGPSDTAEPTEMADLNSILLSDVGAKEWSVITTGVTKAINYAEYTALDGYTRSRGSRLNTRQADPANSAMRKEFVAPPGCTSVVLSIDAMLPVGIAAGTIVAGVYQIDGVTPIQTVACVLSNVMQRFQTPAAAVVAGTEYRVVIWINNVGVGTSVNSTVLIDNIVLTPSGAMAAPFSQPFLRIPIQGRFMHDNRASDIISRKVQVSPLARFVFRTRARIMAIEYIRTLLIASIDPAVFVDGQCIGKIAMAGNNALNIATLALPPGLKTVEVVFPSFNNNANWPNPQNITGAYINAVYVPRDSDTQIVMPTSSRSTRRLVVYGDSITIGETGTACAAKSGLIANLRRSFPGSVMAEAYGSRSLAEDCGTAAAPAVDSPVKRDAFVRLLASYKPTDILFAIGTNDYGGAYWANVAAYSACHLALLNQLQSELPQCSITIQSPLLRATDPANANGWTLAQLRAQIQADVAAAAVLANFSANQIKYIDGAAILTSTTTGVNGWYFDALHPNENGHTKYAESLRASYIANGIGW